MDSVSSIGAQAALFVSGLSCLRSEPAVVISAIIGLLWLGLKRAAKC